MQEEAMEAAASAASETNSAVADAIGAAAAGALATTDPFFWWVPALFAAALVAAIATRIASDAKTGARSAYGGHVNQTFRDTVLSVLWSAPSLALLAFFSFWRANALIEMSPFALACVSSASAALGYAAFALSLSRKQRSRAENARYGSKNGRHPETHPETKIGSVSDFADEFDLVGEPLAYPMGSALAGETVIGSVSGRAGRYGMSYRGFTAMRDARASSAHASSARTSSAHAPETKWRTASGNADDASVALSSIRRVVVAALAVLSSALLTTVAVECAFNPNALSLPSEAVAYELAFFAALYASAYLLLCRHPSAFALVAAAGALAGIAEAFVERFKHTAILPSDLAGVGTAADVAAGYDYTLTLPMCLAAVSVLAVVAMAQTVRDPFSPVIAALSDRTCATASSARSVAVNACAAALSIILAALVSIQSFSWLLSDEAASGTGASIEYWSSSDSYHAYGLVPAFVRAALDLRVEAPGGYDEGAADELISSMSALYDETDGASTSRLAAETAFLHSQPNIVVVMDESFADLSAIGGNGTGLGVGYGGLPFYSSLEDGVVSKGDLAVSVYGGSTCNSEFEFLTGIPISTIGAGANPYSQYDLTGIASLPRALKELGYDTTAVHTETASNWSRDRVYPQLGFDEFMDAGAFAGAELVRGHASDKATYDVVLDELENDGKHGGHLVWDLTMHNHGPYSDSGELAQGSATEDIESLALEDVVDGSAAAQTRDYLAGVGRSDDDLVYLIESLRGLDEPTVVVFFGDHQPGFSWWYADLFLADASEEERTGQLHTTPYIVWSNYDVYAAVASSIVADAQPPEEALAIDDGAYGTDAGGAYEAMQPERDDAAALAGSADGFAEGYAIDDVGLEDVAANADAGISEGSPADATTADASAQNADGTIARQAAEEPNGFGNVGACQLQARVLEAIGAPLTDYQKALLVASRYVPALNAYGWRDAEGVWHALDGGCGIAWDGGSIDSARGVFGMDALEAISWISYREFAGAIG